MANYPLEVYLRPPVEFLSGTVAMASGAICATAPSLLMMAPSVGYTSAAILSGLGVYRYYQGSKVVKYQRNLNRLKRFDMKTSQVPCYSKHLYLGKGFRWGQQHTQRLKDTLAPDAKRYVTPSKIQSAVRTFERKSEGTFLESIGKLTCKDVAYNPFRPLPLIGGNPAIHGIEPNETDVLLPMSERVGHTLVMGTTRCGKTRLAELLINQDIQRGEGAVFIFDPKSDAGLLTKAYTAAKRAGREEDFYVFHLGFPEISARYNGVGNFSRITEVASRISNQLSAEGNSSAFKEFAWRFINIVARALVSIGKRPDYNNILQYVTDIEPLFVEYLESWLPQHAEQGWVEDINDYTAVVENEWKRNPRLVKFSNPRTEAIKRYVEGMGTKDNIVLGLLSTLRYDRNYFDKLVASLLPLLEKLTTGKVGELIAPDYFNVEDERPIIDWTQAIRKKAIIYIGLDAMTDMDVASAVGNSMFSDLVSTAGYIYKHGFEHGMLGGRENAMPKICIHADEFESLMGPEFLPMVNKSGGSGCQVTAYTQSRGDIEARMGDRAKASQIEGNFNNLIMLRVKEKVTAELLTDQLPDVEVSQKMTVSGAADSSDTESTVDFTTNTQDRISMLAVPMLDPSNIIALPKGQAFCLLDGAHLWKVRFPMLDDDAEDIPETLQALTREMQKNYNTADGWWMAA